MEFIKHGTWLLLQSEKKDILFTEENITIDSLLLDMSGEYEKSGFMCHMLKYETFLVAHLRVEGYWIAYINMPKIELNPTLLEFLWSVDILVIPGSKESVWMIEQIDPRSIIAYWPQWHELSTSLGHSIESLDRWKLKETDLNTDKTACILIG